MPAGVLHELQDAGLEVFIGAERVAAGDGDWPAGLVGHERAAARDQEVVFVLSDREGRERKAAMGPEDPIDRLPGRLLAVA